MSKPIDYDAPRRTASGLEDDDGAQELNALSTAARSPRVDPDEAEPADGFDLPAADPSGEELTVPVVPMQTDEFRCARCFLVQHRSQLAGQSNGQDICVECS
jgi:hypothetical protein